MDEPKPMTLEECVRGFLDLAMTHPETPPKRVRDQEANRNMILGFNRAQETLRTILENHGKTAKVRAISEVRNDKQQSPLDIGGRKVWVA